MSPLVELQARAIASALLVAPMSRAEIIELFEREAWGDAQDVHRETGGEA